MPEVPDETLELFLTLMRQVGRLYRSSYGQDLTVADWDSFRRAVEKFDHASDGIILGKAPALPILCQPAAAVQALIDPTESDHHSRVYHLLSRYEFVFQIVRHMGLIRFGGQSVYAALRTDV